VKIFSYVFWFRILVRNSDGEHVAHVSFHVPGEDATSTTPEETAEPVNKNKKRKKDKAKQKTDE
jgi:hypothetical protein